MKITEKENNKLYEILKGIILCLCIMVSLFHIFFDNNAPKLKENYTQYKELLKQRDSVESLLINQLNNKNISNVEFTEKFYSNKSLYKAKIKECNNKKEKYLKTFLLMEGRVFISGFSFLAYLSHFLFCHCDIHTNK